MKDNDYYSKKVYTEAGIVNIIKAQRRKAIEDTKAACIAAISEIGAYGQGLCERLEIIEAIQNVEVE